MTTFLAFAQETWTTKLCGFIRRGNEKTISHGKLSLSRVSELRFIGLQVSFDKQRQVAFKQRRWILSELHTRGWVDLTGTPCLPKVKLNAFGSTETPEYKRNLVSGLFDVGWHEHDGRLAGDNQYCCLSFAQVSIKSVESRSGLLEIPEGNSGHWTSLQGELRGQHVAGVV